MNNNTIDEKRKEAARRKMVLDLEAYYRGVEQYVVASKYFQDVIKPIRV